MAQFFKFLLASILGVLIAGFLMFFIGSLIIAGIAGQADKAQEVKPNTVLHLTFSEPIPELTNNLELSPFDIQKRKVLGLNEIVETLEQAKNDEDIKGIFLETDMMFSSGIATASTLREALLDFKESGKFIVAYSKYYSQGAYFLASTADEIIVHPLGMIDFRGFSAQIPFFKKMLDKVGIKMQVFYAGKFKSATEPYRLEKMSEENRFQTRVFLDEIYGQFLKEISESRNIPVEDLKKIANDYQAGIPEQAMKTGMADVVGYRDEALNNLRTRLGLEQDEDIPTVSLRNYNRSNPPAKNYGANDKIAVIHAEGTIVDGSGQNGSIGDDQYTRMIRKLRKDDRTKAIVLRVNSPGGSAMASESIWRELSLAREAGKPVIVSMGDYAASGGYYISCMADSIFAEPKTLTGSIGVFSMIPDATVLLNDKLGITFDSVKTADMATSVTPYFKMSPKEERYWQHHTDQMYEVFLQRVADGRNMTPEAVNEIAQGRVWVGAQAIDIGLVDRLADLDEAVESAAKMAGLESYRISTYPRVKDPLTEMLEELMGSEEENTARAQDALLKKELPQYYDYYKFVREMASSKGVQARLPLILEF